MADTSTTAAPPAGRLTSLDVFRGLTMAAMVVVNNPGDWGHTYAPLQHAEWNGCTPTDLIFPFFLFIVGVSMTLSRSTTSDWSRILRRAATIVALGWLLSLFPYFRFATWRLPGVLVRIGLCYLAAAAIYRWTLPAGGVADARHGRRLAASAVVLMLAYWAAMILLPWPGHAAGDLTPTGNLGGFIDRALLGQQHLYQQRAWDPEGLLSTVPAISTTLLGIVAGLWLRAGAERAVKAMVLAAAGTSAMALGLAWDLVFPMNKNLWTSSYVMYTAGWAALLLSACYWILDVKGWRFWARPFVILGMNAIALFALSALFVKLLSLIRWQAADGHRISLGAYAYRRWYEPLAAPNDASLLYALTHLAIMFVIVWWMYRRKIFLKA